MATISTGRYEPNLTQWIERLRDFEPAKRLHAATVLGSLGPRAKNAVPALMDALRDRIPEVRRMAAAALSEIGGEARMAIPALMQSVKDPDENVRRRCIIALGGMGVEARMAAAGRWFRRCATRINWCVVGPPLPSARSAPRRLRRFQP